jgi:hypothetical protein
MEPVSARELKKLPVVVKGTERASPVTSERFASLNVERGGVPVPT